MLTSAHWAIINTFSRNWALNKHYESEGLLGLSVDQVAAISATHIRRLLVVPTTIECAALERDSSGKCSDEDYLVIEEYETRVYAEYTRLELECSKYITNLIDQAFEQVSCLQNKM